MERRKFILSSCNACMLLTAGFLLPTLSGCDPAFYRVVHAEISNDQIEVPLAGFGNMSLQVVRPTGWYYSIAVRKKEDQGYSALLLKCTHQDNQLTVLPMGFNCSLHGSAFNEAGKVTKGPAEKTLKEYPVTIDHNNIIIHLKA